MSSPGLMGSSPRNQRTRGGGTPVASQNSVKGLCRAAETLVTGSKSPVSSGGTRHRGETTLRLHMGAVCSFPVPQQSCPARRPTPGRESLRNRSDKIRVAPAGGSDGCPQAGLWQQPNLGPQFPRSLRRMPGGFSKNSATRPELGPGWTQMCPLNPHAKHLCAF